VKSVRAVSGPRHIVLAVSLICAIAEPAAALDTHRADVKRFVAQTAKMYSIKKRQLRKLLAGAQSQPAIIEAMDRPAEKAKLWYEYRAAFLTERRVREGVDFWTLHRAELDQASLRTGVAPEYLVAILGVETYYGRLVGRYRVLDALATLAFDYPARSKYFQEELQQFILLTREASIDPLTAVGSYAGAMGAPQFMPTNYRRYALDANGDGHIDLWTNWPDVFASTGNYLNKFGWTAGEPVLSSASVDPEKTQALDGRTLVVSETIASLKSKGVDFESTLPDDAPALLIATDEADGIHWRVGYKNFYVITRYNHSPLYAMAVYELAAAVKTRILMNAARRPGDAPASAVDSGGAAPSSAAPSSATPGDVPSLGPKL
jgi:membrane-bound lytic murein transglycosylase B